MLTALRETQLPLLAAVLITAGLAKLILRGPGVPEGAPVVEVLRHHRGLAVVTALAEVGLGVALLVAPYQGVRVATVIWFVGATWIADELRTRRPEAGCGCFGALSTTRIGVRVMLRPIALAGAALATLGLPQSGQEGLLGLRLACLLCEVALVAALSPEVGVLLARLRSKAPCELRQVPLSQTMIALKASRAWREHGPVLQSTEPVEVWRELCWRFLVFRACSGPGSGGREQELVFAVSLASGHRPEVRAALVDLPGSVTDKTCEDDEAIEDTGPNPLAPVAV